MPTLEAIYYLFHLQTKMKIWVDLRNIQKDHDYFSFVITLLEGVINSHESYFFYLFVNTPLDVSGERIFVNHKDGEIGVIDQIKFVQKLKWEKIDVMLFFDPRNAILYTGRFILFQKDLREIFYNSEKSPIKRNIHLFMYKYALKRTQRVLCFDKETYQEINERFDVKEEKIVKLPPFFEPVPVSQETRSDVATLAVRSRHSITGDFLIYDAGNGIERNIDRLIECIAEINKWGRDISLFIVGEWCSQDIVLRHTVIDQWIQNKIVFLWELNFDEQRYYYEAALWVVNSSQYDALPIHTNHAMTFRKPMIMSDLSTLKNIFWEKVSYFNPLSKNDMVKQLELFLEYLSPVNYSEIFEKFQKEETIKITDEIIKKSC